MLCSLATLKGPRTSRPKFDISCILTSWSLNDQWKIFLKPLCPFKLAPKFGFLVLLVSKTASPPNKFVTQMTSPPKLKVSQTTSPPQRKLLNPEWSRNKFGGDAIWETFSFGDDAKKVINLFGGDAVLETSSTRKPNFGANLKGQSGFKKKFRWSFSDQEVKIHQISIFGRLVRGPFKEKIAFNSTCSTPLTCLVL